MPVFARLGRAARAVPAVLVIAAAVSGCADQRLREQPVAPEVARAALADKPFELKRHFMVALAQGPRNRVLNDMRLGLASMALDQTDLAAHLFDDALDGIEAVYAETESAERARKLFVKEAAKDFKGEPYERAMAYYYRGLLYLRAGDFDNAHASFKGGLIQDSFAEDERYRADFGLLAYLEGWASRCAGNTTLARADDAEFREIDSRTPLPADDQKVLVIAETGQGPMKRAVSPNGDDRPRALTFRRIGPAGRAQVSWRPPTAGKDAPSKTVALLPVEDIFHQASTRGGRAFDMILDGKAQFKSTANTIGDVALVGALGAASVASNSRNRDVQNGAAIATGALLMMALIGKATAAAVEADADTRTWETLPDQVHLIPLNLPDSVTHVTVTILRPDGEPRLTREVPVHRAKGCGLAWLREGPPVPALRAPNSAPADQMGQPVALPADPAPPTPAAPGPTAKE